MPNSTPYLLLALLFSSASAEGEFNYASYTSADIDELVEQSRHFTPGETTGQTLLTPPKKVHLLAQVESYPKPCPDELPHILLKTVRVLDPPPMGRCMQLRSQSGSIINAWIQESISDFVREEYALGDPIEVRALWLFVNGSDKKPYFVINGIGPSDEPESSERGRWQ
jgi:hypothetical protein